MPSYTSSRETMLYKLNSLRCNIREVSLMRVAICPHFPSLSLWKCTDGCKLEGTTGSNLVQTSTQSQVKSKVLLYSVLILTFPYKYLMTKYANVREKGSWQFSVFKLMLAIYDFLLYSSGWLVLIFVWFCCFCCGVLVNTKNWAPLFFRSKKQTWITWLLVLSSYYHCNQNTSLGTDTGLDQTHLEIHEVVYCMKV